MENKKIQSFKDLVVWQKAKEFAVFIYKISGKFPKDELYGLTSQMRRAAISVSSNIAEGFKRSSKKEKSQFYQVALGSLAETESQIEIAKHLGFVNEDDYGTALNFIQNINRMLEKLVISAQNKQ
jgi:four helix bundle protein